MTRVRGPSQRTHPLRTIEDLTPDPRNANRGTPRDRALLGQSLRTYGAGRSILADRHGQIIAGNKTLKHAAALQLPIRVVDSDGSELVVVRRTDLDLAHDHRARELALADNRVAELDLAWDPDMLKQLRANGVEFTAFWRADEWERLVGVSSADGLTPENQAITPRATRIRRGDLFRLGAHRLLCGDATSAGDVQRLFGRVVANVMVTDPPYGVSYDPAWRNRGIRPNTPRSGASPVTTKSTGAPPSGCSRGMSPTSGTRGSLRGRSPPRCRPPGW